MQAASATSPDAPDASRSPRHLPFAAAVALLFVAYQLPEGIGDRLMHSIPVQAGLLVVFFIVAYFVARGLGCRGYNAYAMERKKGWGGILAITLACAFAAKVLALIAGSAMGIYNFAPRRLPAASALGGLLGFAFISTIMPSIAEDIVTRGVWYREGPRSWTGARFVFASSAVYVLNHIYRLANGPSEWFMLFVFGLAYATALVRTRTLWAAIGLHWGWNLCNALIPLVADVNVLRADLAPFVSAAAHVLMLAGVVAMTRNLERESQVVHA